MLDGCAANLKSPRRVVDALRERGRNPLHVPPLQQRRRDDQKQPDRQVCRRAAHGPVAQRQRLGSVAGCDQDIAPENPFPPLGFGVRAERRVGEGLARDRDLRRRFQHKRRDQIRQGPVLSGGAYEGATERHPPRIRAAAGVRARCGPRSAPDARLVPARGRWDVATRGVRRHHQSLHGTRPAAGERRCPWLPPPAQRQRPAPRNLQRQRCNESLVVRTTAQGHAGRPAVHAGEDRGPRRSRATRGYRNLQGCATPELPLRQAACIIVH